MKAPFTERKYIKTFYFLAAVGIVLTLILIGATDASYLYKKKSSGTVKAKEFYFTSNLLDGQPHTLAPGSTQITFTLGNHPDELRFSQTPITYTVEVDGDTPDGENLTGTLEAGSIQNQSVTITGLVPGYTYTVTAEGDGGYHQTLTATLVIPEEEKYLYKYLNTTNSEYVELTVWAKGISGEVSITAPTSVLPNNANLVMAEAKNGAESTFTFTDANTFKDAGYCSYTYRFFGSGVTASDFTVICGDFTAEEKNPD